LEQFRRYRIPFSLIMIDIDHFKNINDSFGHLEGDRVLCDMAECLARNIRRIDMLGRWGGEEFMIICPATDLKGGFGLAEKLRIAIADFQYSTGRSHSASFGVSQVDVADNLSTLLARADRQLYRAKESGRNRVCAECSAA
jgi:diguanylate cyclase (GGDEF)-like protein